MKEYETVKNKVREILRIDERSRNNDNRLVFLYWEEELREKTDYYTQAIINNENVATLTPYKDVYNARSDIQNKEALYLPTIPEIMIRRKIKQEAIRQYYGEQSKEMTETMKIRYTIQ